LIVIIGYVASFNFTLAETPQKSTADASNLVLLAGALCAEEEDIQINNLRLNVTKLLELDCSNTSVAAVVRVALRRT
jgi:hypothetical protein